jgi:hypothetical protein
MPSGTHPFQVAEPSTPAIETEDGGTDQFEAGAVAMGGYGDWTSTLPALKYEQVEKLHSFFLRGGLQFVLWRNGLHVRALQRKTRRGLGFKRNLRLADVFIEGRAELSHNPLHVAMIRHPNGFCTQFLDARLRGRWHT